MSIPNRAGSDATLDQATSLRIDFLRLALVIGIVFLHAPPLWSLESLPPAAHQWPGVAKLFIEFGPLRAAVPVLALMSGYLLFLRPYGSYSTLVRRKVTTLLIPFLIWNAVAITLRLAQGRSDPASFGLPADATSESWLSPLAAFLQTPPDFPTFFLIDLFSLALVSPLIATLLRGAPIATLVAAAFAAALGYGPVPGARPDVALPFIVGAAGAMYRIDPRLVDRYVWLLTLGFLALSVAFIAAAAAEVRTPVSLGLVRAAGLPAIWALSAVLAPTALGRRLAAANGFAFVLFCAHVPALQLLAGLWPKAAGPQLFYVVAAPSAIATVLLMTKALARWGGPALALLAGARTGVAPSVASGSAERARPRR